MNNNTKFPKKEPLNEKKLEKIFESIIKKLEDRIYLQKYIKKEEAFTRTRKMPLEVIVKLLFASACYSLTLFLMISINNEKKTVTKQAYSKARKNIDSKLFVDLNKELVEEYYKNYEVNKYEGKYILLAIDGSSLEIPNTKELREEYGHSKGQEGAKQLARANISCIYDPLNEIIVTTTLEKNNTSERKMAKEMIGKMDKNKTIEDETLYIMDRGYFSVEMLVFLLYHKKNFLFRIQQGNLKKYFENMVSDDEWMEMGLSGVASKIKDEELRQHVKKEMKSVRLRFTKVELSTGEIEYLVSNIEDIRYENMKELYYKRWGIETNYNFLKNRLKIENFSGKQKITIEQDFYAGILNANIQYLIKKTIEKKKTKKHEYQPSMNVVSGLYKENIVFNILSSLSKIKRLFKKILKLAKKTLIMKTPPEKTNPRVPNDKVRANRYFTNIRPN